MAYANAAVTDYRQRFAGTLAEPLWSATDLGKLLFLMSGHGLSVSAQRMIADSDYAREQLRLACTTDDQALQQLAVEMLNAIAHLSRARNQTHWSQ